MENEKKQEEMETSAEAEKTAPEAADTAAPAEEPKKKSDKKTKAELAKCREENEKLTAALEEEKKNRLYLAAEYDNFRRRSQKEKEGIYGEAYADVVKEILPLFDNLERAGQYSDAQKVVLSDLAYPGTSEHQTGLCVDFVTSATGDDVVEAFEYTAAFAWLQNNAYKFGFILRYPKDKVDTTGYTYEPWHYRFVGREAATDMCLSGLCLEEYLTALQ